MSKKLMCVALLCGLGWSQVAPAGLVGWWKLDETSGTKVSDASGNNLTGNFAGTGTPVWAAGKLDGALQLDGKSWVDFGNPAQALMTGTTPLSVSVWINPSNLGTQLGVSGHDRSFLARQQDWVFKASGPYARFTTPGVLDYNAMNTLLKTNEWQHVVVAFQPGAPGLAVFYLNGVETDRVNSTSLTNGGYSSTAPNLTTNANGGPVLLGNNQFTTATASQCYYGLLDDVQLYNRVLTAAQVKEVFAGARAYFPKAWNPTPADKATNISQSLLQWGPGEGAASHSVYVGTSPDLTAANLIMTVPALSPDFAATVYPAGLTPGVTYFWRVDETDAAGKVTPGDVWSFTATPKAAWSPNPADGAPYLPTSATLSWMAGMNAVSHDVYLSADQAAVNTGAAAAKVADKQTTLTYAASGLTRATTYFWRVDEHLVDGTTVPGAVWSFDVRPVFAKSDPNLVAWWKLDEAKSAYAADYSGSDYFGTLVGTPTWVDGYFGTGLKCNGTTDYVNFGTPAPLYQPKTYTYSLWFQVGKNIDGNSGPQNLLCLGSRSDLVLGIHDSVGANGDLSLHYYDTAPGFHAVSVGRVTWPAGEWHMVTATKDAAGHKLYLDGVLKSSDTNTRDDNFGGATTRMISLGARGWTTPRNGFLGVLDDVRIYNRALSAEEITQVMRGDPSLAWNGQPSSATVDIRDTSALTWSAGDGAAKHDVYFGTDPNAVKAADTTSPLYQGRVATTSFSLAGLVTFGGGTYYWRIDEVEADGKTIHPGVLWSFTVPAYLAVDDFESYDDDLNRLYDTWIDGLGGNGSCSTVGNLPTQAQLNAGTGHFAERTIIHGGRQSMPVDYNNVKAPFYSEATRTFTPLQTWTGYDANALSLWFRGRLATPGVVETAPGQYQIGACSNDIWGTADSFAFYYKTLTGDGSISAKVVAITNTTTNWAKAAVMVRDSLAPGAMYANMFPTPDGRRAFQNRPTANGNAFSAHSATGQVKLPFWVKLERKGNQITGYYSADGTTWTRQPDTENTGTDKSYNPAAINLGTTICLGLAVASNNFGAASCFGEFAEVTTTGAVSGAWQLVKIGTTYSNDPDPLYVAVADSTGKSVAVTYPDPAAVTFTSWTQWKIPLSSLMGLNLTKVQKLTVGVGNKAAPNAGTTGRVYFDDIFVTK